MANRRNLVLLGIAVAVTAAAAPAAVLSTPPVPPTLAKAEAIIGGQSRLAAILEQQGVRPRPAAIRPSGYGIQRRATSVPAMVRIAPVASSDRPDVFGTVALKVNRTSLDQRWRNVERVRVGGSAAVYARSLRKLDKTKRLEAINRYVNGRVEFVDDSRQYRRADVWATANATLNRGRGDCEDYAIAKLQMLRAAGFSDMDLYLVVLKDLVRRSDHAVAVVRSGDQMLVLDNGTDQIFESQSVTDYRPVFSFAANGTWTHGYKLAAAAVEVAYAHKAAASELVPAASGIDQRSRNASLRALSTGLSR